MNRNLIIGERIMYVDATTPVNCIFTVTLRGVLTPEQLRLALNGLQAKHPLLRAAIREDASGRPSFVVLDPAPVIPVRIAERLSDRDWEQVSREEWGKKMEVETGPLARVVWLKAEASSDLLLICSHCICDGTSIVTLMRELLLLLDEPQHTLQPYLPFTTVEALLPDDVVFNRSRIRKAKMLSKLVHLLLAVKPLPRRAPQGNSYMLHWKLQADITRSLISQCKAERSSLHAAFCVAFLEAFRAIRGRQAHGKTICPVDIRRYIPAIREDNLFAFAPTANLTLRKGGKVDLWTKSRKLKEELNRKIDKMNVQELLMLGEYFHSSVKRMVAHLKTTKGTHDFTLSNMGRLRIPDQYRSFEVETVYSPTVAFPWRNPNTIVITAFRGQLDFTFLSNDAMLPVDEAVGIKEKAMALLTDMIIEQ